MASEELSFKIAAFEGPLDLLLHLISKNKVSIWDIPIAEITDQYFEYMAAMQELDMELGGEFLVMASQLLLIKSRMLLPAPEEEEEDPRMELAERLEEYRRYKLIAADMDKLQHSRDNVVFKGEEPLDFPKVKLENKQLEVGTLFAAFMTVLQRGAEKVQLKPGSFRGVIGRTNYSIRLATTNLLGKLDGDDAVEFGDLFDGLHARGEYVATFLALLELIKENFVSVVEDDGKIYCMRGEKDGEYAFEEY
ncbi:MAG: segregation/condensation protein A [Oscillospiraceae bacterium]|nr:segregation/condensation protein A [Oscillospiraceae bacterium]